MKINILKSVTSKEKSKLNWARLKISVKNVKTPPRYWRSSGAGLYLRAVVQEVARLRPNSVVPQRYARLRCSVGG